MMLPIAWFLMVCMVNRYLAAKLPSPQPTYITRYDYLDIDKVLTNERILRRLMDCILDRGPCTREGKELKRIIPDALRTNCSKCNDRQKMNTGRALAYLLQYKPEYWSELISRFDQDGSFRKKLNLDDSDDDKVVQSTTAESTTKASTTKASAIAKSAATSTTSAA